MKEIRKTYSSGDVVIVWQPALCIHSEKCAHGLSKVFDPKRRPWIDASAASAKEIIAQVAACPSGALSLGKTDQEAPAAAAGAQAEVLRDGPLLLKGELNITLADGSVESRSGVTAFCRCGASSNKPYCDGSHKALGFIG